MEKHLQAAQFLHERNPNRYKQGDAHRMERILRRAGFSKPGLPQNKIAAWLELAERTQKNPAAIERLKTKLLKDLVIQPEDADAYFAFQARIERELGHGEVRYTAEIRTQLFNTLVQDQQQSLLAWWEYLNGRDSNTYPTWAKIWAFEEMTKLKALESGETKFAVRTRETQGLFPELDREALAKVMDALIKRAEGKPIEDAELQELLKNPRFGELYAHALQKTAVQKADLNITTGKWIKYPKGSAPKELVRSIDCKGTGWCTAGEKTAELQLAGGDFYIYYSNDRLGRPTQPRIAIRMEGENITEVRGIGKEQHLDAAMAETDVLETKLKEFGPEGAKYKKRSSDMKRLTLIEKKHNRGLDLTDEELRFIYEVDAPIEGFGYSKDPRNVAIIKKRNTRDDLSKALQVDPSKISLTREEALRGDVVFHFGDLDLSNFTSAEGLKLPQRISGSLALGRLIRKEGLKLPDRVGGSLNLANLTSVQDLVFPEYVGGALVLSKIRSANGAHFPKHVGGNLNLDGLTSAIGLELPSTIEGSISLVSLSDGKGLVFPEFIGEDITLTALRNASGVRFPKRMDGVLTLSGLTTARGLKLPRYIGGYLDLLNLRTANGLKLPDFLGGDLGMENLIRANGLVFPSTTMGNLMLQGLRTMDGLTLTGQIDGTIGLGRDLFADPATQAFIRRHPHYRFIQPGEAQ